MSTPARKSGFSTRVRNNIFCLLNAPWSTSFNAPEASFIALVAGLVSESRALVSEPEVAEKGS
jgi:hypothetical protein